MKTIGLIGGMSWESSAEYYRLINEAVREKLGGLHSAKCILYSVDFAAIEMMQQQGRWEEAAQALITAAHSLEQAGADFLILCTNTMHKVAEAIQKNIHIPFMHIADATAQKIREQGLQRVGLLGTRFTMEEDFYKNRLVEGYDLEVIIPEVQSRRLVNQVIYDELCLGVIRAESKAHFVRIVNQLVQKGAEGVILGCTEIGLLLLPEDCQVPVFDTTRIHALRAVDYALQE